jgi:hypothetical protein
VPDTSWAIYAVSEHERDDSKRDMSSIAKWSAAVAVTIAAFAAAAWIGGVLILPIVIKDSGTRWGLAGALGVAMAALAALWGHSFATAEASETDSGSHHAPAPDITTREPGNTRNKITGGTFHGPVIQGRDIHGPAAFTTPPRQPDPESKG